MTFIGTAAVTKGGESVRGSAPPLTEIGIDSLRGVRDNNLHNQEQKR